MKTFDVVVVGGGMLGMAHAWACARRGLSVAVVERAVQAHGATIRNFGQVLVTGQAPGEMAGLARQTRALWLELAGRAGFHVRSNGCLVLARNAHERDVLEEFASARMQAEGYAAQLLTGRELGAYYGGRLDHHCAALRGSDDLQIYSREALPAITRHLAQDLGVAMINGTLARRAEGGEVHTSAGVLRARHVFVCPGHDYLTLWPELFEPLKLEATRLQMLRLAFAEHGFALDMPLLTGLSCVHYGAFSDLPSAQRLRQIFEARSPFLMREGIHLLISPTPYGELIVGDSHRYGVDAPPFNDEAVDEALIALAQQALGARLRVLERWQGVYGAHGPAPYSVLQADAHTTVALMHSGVGMTVGLAIGENSVAAVLG
ncbi:TIGR03364 family FAD-dependent oxidoreductase [Bordetella avium]|uniref:Oxidoreductase n=1 Tax=Bordetella avium (strain 197N) TaxID=360910 RepID=Q2L2D9_BORA1|nr:TIGR03364 family FAD-dependent oxidoreductase [Bordetella avium]AZY48683.1 TIGR03364 family FAD-dependent oxidoreductase [Bordetella avium]AZY52064.1 TIGR03364 family FAD-dependent oxidoreductase [Bordetella avium]RIQ13991.1 TIGR03364 family FAD-dependent oxidoreductase [Bordetella avium]RIQ16934.1 TIGR03364 family FAD-dependent oxidoreductase [Bordetella avium]RIQ36340.1 TIGR03364 family FAD-dependent oxidoreductase [Bordetella avium]